MKILVFDDAELRNLLKVTLEHKGHKVTALADRSEFQHFGKLNCPCPQGEPCTDLLIADIVMPNMEGIDFCKQLKEAGCTP